MRKFIKRFLKDEEGMETIEVVVIIGILVAVALVFKDGIIDFVKKLMAAIFKIPTI